MIKAGIFAICTLVAAPGWAQDDSLRDMTLQEWQDLALGKTLTYQVAGEFYALERYARTGRQVELQFANGACLAGTWTHSGNLFCFDYGHDRPHCFRHVKAGDEILILNVQDGAETGDIQIMSDVTDAPLSCGLNLS